MVSRVDCYPLLRSARPLHEHRPLRLLLLGTCTVGRLGEAMRQSGNAADHLLCESYSISEVPAADYRSYDCVLVALTFRHIVEDAAQSLSSGAHPPTCTYWVRALADGREQEYFDACASVLEQRVDRFCAAMRGATLFFPSIIEPMHNYHGNLLPRHRLSNPVYFTRRLNEVLETAVLRHAGAHFLDMNELICLLGRARIQDDYINQLSHASFLGNDLWDADRLQPSTPPVDMYDCESQILKLGALLLQRLRDDLAILSAPLRTKAIIVDLDDTLWRGIAAEEDRPLYEFTEGWPLGLMEALLIYKARGGLLAICSKNDLARTQERFDKIFNQNLRFDDFSSIRINDRPKSENIRSILDDLNLLPDSVLYIDDNPREIDEVKASFPAIETLSAEHYDWRRRILMSADTQVATVTAEARRRTQSVQSRIKQIEMGRMLDRDEWLSSLELTQRYEAIRNTDSAHFGRALELINKTNQFNTTGKRWERREIETLFQQGGWLVCSFLRDRTLDNGLIGVCIIRENWIVQVVLSCRVFNLGSEEALGHLACQLILNQHDKVFAASAQTSKNLSCRDYFSRLGFQPIDGNFVGSKVPAHPPYIRSELVNYEELASDNIVRGSNGVALPVAETLDTPTEAENGTRLPQLTRGGSVWTRLLGWLP